ncbi:MAG: hypothetical protein ABI045_05115 [Flavobacteriales bacterium]
MNPPKDFQAQIELKISILIFEVSYEKYAKISRFDFSFACGAEQFKAGITHLPLVLDKVPCFGTDVII